MCEFGVPAASHLSRGNSIDGLRDIHHECKHGCFERAVVKNRSRVESQMMSLSLAAPASTSFRVHELSEKYEQR